MRWGDAFRLMLKKYGGGSISRILFRIDRAYGGDHVSTAYVTTSLQQPTREPRPGRPFPNAPAHPGVCRGKPNRPFGASSYLVLLRVMLTLPSTSPRTRWALTPPFHPYPRPPEDGPGAVSFLWRSCRITPPGRYPAPCPVESGLSSHLKSGKRPPDPRPHTRKS